MQQLDPVQVEMLEDARDGLEVQTKQWAVQMIQPMLGNGGINNADDLIAAATKLATWMSNSTFRIKIPALDEAAAWKEQRLATGEAKH